MGFSSFPITASLFPLILLCMSMTSRSSASRTLQQQQLNHTTAHEVEMNSLLPQDTCSQLQLPSFTMDERQSTGTSLPIVHAYGPCSQLMKSGKLSKRPSLNEILQHDRARASLIRHGKGRRHHSQSRSDLPASSGKTIGYNGGYIVTVGLGTPKRQLSLVLDTGSDLTWTQCKPCQQRSFCYHQTEPIFDPRVSTTYSNISCTSSTCSDVIDAGQATGDCTSSPTCSYSIMYGDGSFTLGFLATEKLTLSPRHHISNFIFGCGQDNEGLLNGSAGLMGLGRSKFSTVSQASKQHGNYFSYCLPSQSTDTGHLTFGKGGTRAKRFFYTPLLSSSTYPTFYFVDLVAITVDGNTLSIPPSVFSMANTILDSGSEVTSLPPKAYSALRHAFRTRMSSHGYHISKTNDTIAPLDTCYDLSSYHHKGVKVKIPKVALIFKGHAVMGIVPQGIMYGTDSRQMCLGFYGNSNPTYLSVIGNLQQQTFDIIHDLDGRRIGFGPNGC